MSGLPAPYYQDADCTLYLGDCRDVLPRLEPESIDLLLTDPPYGAEWESGRRQQSFGPIAGDGDQSVARDGLRACMAAIRRSRHLYVFGRFDLAGLPVSDAVELIWDKEHFNAGDLSIPWGNQHEYICFAVKLLGEAQRRGGHGNHAARLRRGSVLRYLRPNASAVTRHPTEKPVPLLRELIESSTRMGETVLDPFAGSGSTGVAAKLEGRRSVLIEVEERYCEVAARRLAQQVLPLEIA